MNPVYTLLVRAVLSVIFVSFYGFIVLRVLSMDREFMDGVKEVLLFLLGALTTSVVTVIGYWFTTSQGSVEKTAVLAQVASHSAADSRN